MKASAHMENRAYSIPQVREMLGIGRTRLYKLIADRELVARKIGARTVIFHDDYQRYVENAPIVTLGKGKSE